MSAGVRVSVAADVFAAVPTYERVVFGCRVVDPTAGVAWIGAELAREAGRVRSATGDVPIVELPVVAAWREAFRATGTNPSKFRPAHEALLRRVLRGEDLQLGNPLVDLGTAASLRAGCPVGMHTLDRLADDAGGLELRPATGTETFVGFDDTTSSPDPGELVYAHGERVLTRRWAWRQGSYGSVRDAGPHLLAVNVDLLPVPDVDQDAAVTVVAALLERAGARDVTCVRLTATQRSATLPGPDPRDRC